MKNRFLNVCLGISAVVLSVAFLIRSVQPAQATPTPQDFADAGTNKIGKYMMILSPETEKYYESIYIWDTETGNSVRYKRSGDAFTKTTSLPDNPMYQ